jgi:hypothetical protein
MSIILQCDGLLGNMAGTIYGEQVKWTVLAQPSKVASKYFISVTESIEARKQGFMPSQATFTHQ